ncbi:hypothetical protein HC752_23430 [Vibrio sp. S9_S30]|uniref:hypothetical protein n=1 Tax=Vibrio sp. S9_S30 TaxID=2720226 RepID=UPI001680BEA6|nr:hypothetical protein [Vibrio sp. S9_S30]MBD1559885.1 hypothetical protein [Vibrio sp. S9_S30]
MKNLSLKFKIIATTTLSVIVTAVSIASFSANELNKQTNLGIEQRVNAVSAAASEGIGDWMDAKYFVVESAAQHVSLGTENKKTLKMATEQVSECPTR